MTVRISQIEIEAFRGFAERREIPLDADVVLLTGDNGSGKTSLVDAITWALTGHLPYLEAMRQRKNEEVLVNTYRGGDQATVRVVFVAEDQREFTIERRGDSFSTTLEADDDSESEPTTGDEAAADLADFLSIDSSEDLAAAVEDWGILRQDELRAVLAADPDDLHSRLRDLLGLAVLDEFTEAVSREVSRRTQQSSEALAQLQVATHEAARADQAMRDAAASGEALPALQEAKSGWTQGVDRASGIVVVQPFDLDNVSQANDVLARLRSAFERLREVIRDLEAVEVATPIAIDLIEASKDRGIAERAAAEAAERVKAAEERLQRTRRDADAISALTAAAIPLLTDVCPVCAQHISKESVEARLRGLADAQEHESLNAAQEGVARATREFAGLQAEARTARDREATSLADSKRAANRAQTRSIAIDSLRTLGQGAGLELPLLSLDQPSLSDAQLTLQQLTALGTALRDIQVRRQAISLADLPALQAEAVQAANRAKAADESAQRAGARRATAEQLLRASREGATEVTASSLERLNPLFGELYRRLSPHPTFTELEMTHDYYNRRGRTMGRLTDPLYQISVNPNVICSVGQANVVALSYFLALSLMSGRRGLPFLVMDDPLQSLDDVNVLGFADLCRRLRTERQLIITTHDRRYSRLLARKLASRTPASRTLHLAFTGWDRTGPRVETTHPNELPVMVLAG